jgi:hypothetical protein
MGEKKCVQNFGGETLRDRLEHLDTGEDNIKMFLEERG